MVAEAIGCPRNVLLASGDSIDEWLAYFSLKQKDAELGRARNEAAAGANSVKKSLFRG